MSFSKLGTRKHGGTDCVRPPLKSAMAFSGIAGVVSPEQGERDELSGGPMPSINTKSSEAADMQDLYRRTLAASWNSHSTDLPADKLVEDLFAGGTAWDNGTDDTRSSRLDDSLRVSESPGVGTDFNPARLSPGFERHSKSPSGSRLNLQTDGKHPGLNARRGGSIEQQIYDNPRTKGFKSRTPENEVSEFDVRENLRSWEIPRPSDQR